MPEMWLETRLQPVIGGSQSRWLLRNDAAARQTKQIETVRALSSTAGALPADQQLCACRAGTPKRDGVSCGVLGRKSALCRSLSGAL